MTSVVDRNTDSVASVELDFETGDPSEKQQGLSSSTAIPGVKDEEFTTDAQYGVLAVEAMTTVWSKRDLVIAFVL